jgi:hypothetical protein
MYVTRGGGKVKSMSKCTIECADKCRSVIHRSKFSVKRIFVTNKVGLVRFFSTVEHVPVSENSHSTHAFVAGARSNLSAYAIRIQLGVQRQMSEQVCDALVRPAYYQYVALV